MLYKFAIAIKKSRLTICEKKCIFVAITQALVR